MSGSKRGIAALCACAIACILVSIGGASVGRTEVGAHWRVNSENATNALFPQVQVKEVENLNILSKVSGIKVEISCTGALLEGVKLSVGGILRAGVNKVKLTGCLTKLNEIKQVACEPHNGTEKGVIQSVGLKGSLVLHEGAQILRLEPSTGETLATIATSAECLAGENIPLLGKLTLKSETLGTEAATHLMSEGPLTELWLTSKTEEHKATIDGGLVLELSGEHKGLQWSAVEVGGVANWQVSGTGLVGGLSPLVKSELVKGSTPILLSEIFGKKLELPCTTVKLVNVYLRAEGKIGEASKVVFTGCKIKLGGKEEKECEPHSIGASAGTIETLVLKSLIVLHLGAALIALEPKTGEILAKPEMSKECSIGESIKVIGKLTLKDSFSLPTDLVQHLLSEGPLTELWVNSKTAEHKTVLDGALLVTLDAEFLGLTWSGTPS